MTLLAFCLGAFVGAAFSFVVVFEHYRTRQVESSCVPGACCCRQHAGRSTDN